MILEVVVVAVAEKKVAVAEKKVAEKVKKGKQYKLNFIDIACIFLKLQCFIFNIFLNM